MYFGRYWQGFNFSLLTFLCNSLQRAVMAETLNLMLKIRMNLGAKEITLKCSYNVKNKTIKRFCASRIFEHNIRKINKIFGLDITLLHDQMLEH